MNFVVLVKLVPDIRHIPPEAWDLSRGTLKRNRLRLVPNPMDDRALRLAMHMRQAWGGEVTAVSMGPPAAEDLCYRALAFGADHAILVTDPACAGADTLATSVVLARAIEFIPGDSASTIILSGMQSPDGDTAQVPVQVAAKLGAHVIPYVTHADVTAGGATFTSIGSRGSYRTSLAPADAPAVITCTDQLPGLAFHASFKSLSRAVGIGVETATAEKLGLPPHEVGLAGSATRVVTISVAESVRRETRTIDWASPDQPGAAREIVLAISRGLSGGTAARGLPARKPRSVSGRRFGAEDAVWAVVESPAEPERLGILAHARRIADDTGRSVVAVRLIPRTGNSGDDEAFHRAVRSAGATESLTLSANEGFGLSGASLEAVAHALASAVAHFRPQVVLFPASPEGRVVAPYLAALLGAGLTADCTDFEVRDYRTRVDGSRRTFLNALFQKRPALGGNIQATIVSPANIERGLPQLATVRPGPTEDHESPDDFPVSRWEVPENPARAERSPVSRDETGPERDYNRIEIERCTVLVSAGRGLGGADEVRNLAEPLARAIRDRFDVDTDVSASRLVVDAGLLERERQVGQTGKVVAPDVYIALGISGAAQHRAGMDGSATIIAVNTDADAPIRLISDVFVHGRAEDVVPGIIRALEESDD